VGSEALYNRRRRVNPPGQRMRIRASPHWAMKRGTMTPAYTARWSDLAIVKA
jgi:hypothetical protein